MAIAVVTRRYTFQAVHTLMIPAARESCHGHHFYLEVTFQHAATLDIDAWVQCQVLDLVQARELNSLIQPATGENLVNWIHGRLCESPLGRHIVAVAIQETRKNRFVSARSESRYV